MEKLNYYSALIDKAIEIVSNLGFSSGFIVYEYDKYYPMLEEANQNLLTVSLSEIEMEIWEQRTQFSNHTETLAYVNNFFLNLYEWKEGINTVEEMINSVNYDLSFFDSKCILCRYTTSQKSSIRKVYLTIALKLHQLRINYKEICDRFVQRIKAPENQKSMNDFWRAALNFRLNPEYASQFAEYLNAAIDKKWFEVVNPDKLLLKTDILNYIGNYLGCPFPEINPENNPLLATGAAYSINNPDVGLGTEPETNALAAHLLHVQPLAVAQKIKSVFNIEKGKSIRLLIKALEENNPPLITIANRNFKTVYNALHECLGRDIGSYQSVKGYIYNDTADRQDFEAIKQKLNHALANIE